MQSKKTHKVKINALFHRLQINKNIKFQTRIMWKRHQNKAETRLVNHEHGYSSFDENLTLQFNLVYDEVKGIYEDKNTEVVAVISYEGRVKSGGYAKYNIAQVINQQLQGKLISIPLTQCPDPHANVEVTFTYSLEQEGFSEVASVLNASSRDLNMSRIDFQDDKISLQMDRINTTISKLDELAHSLKNKEKSTLQKVPQLTKRVHELEGQNETLKKNMKKLQEKLEAKEKEERERAKNDQKTITGLQKQLQKKSREFQSKEFIELEQEKKNISEGSKKDKQIQRYKQQLAEAEKQIEQLRKEVFHKQGYIVPKEDAAAMKKNSKISEQLKELREQNNGLKNNVAAMSFKLAKLFNAAYDYGDSKLLDYLQSAIGLTQN